MENTKKAFTLVELLVYIVISVLMLYWVTTNFQILSDLIYRSDLTVKTFQDLENFKDDFEFLKSKYTKNLYSTWNIFSNSEFWFELCVYSNEENTWWIILWVMEKSQNNLKVWLYENVSYFTPFILELNSPIDINNLNDNIFSNWYLRSYQNINLLRFSCLQKNIYTKMDLIILSEIEKSDIWKSLVSWNKTSTSKKIYLTILK
jgi:hypothetical protein